MTIEALKQRLKPRYGVVQYASDRVLIAHPDGSSSVHPVRDGRVEGVKPTWVTPIPCLRGS